VPRTHALTRWPLAGAFALLGCHGIIGEPGLEIGADPTNPYDPTDPTDPTAPYVPGDDPLALPTARIWRLSPIQYERAFRATFGTTHATAADFATDARRGGLDDIASQNHVDASWAVTVYENAAATGLELAPRILTGHPCLEAASPSDVCVDELVAEYADAAFRHPTTSGDRAPFVALFRALLADENPLADAIAGVVEAIAQAPLFLYRTEIGEPLGDGTSRLDAFSLASQLSFMLTDSPPDAMLRADAESGRILERDAVRAHAERLLETPEAIEKVTKFFDQYLGTFMLDGDTLPKDPEVFPEFSSAIQRAMLDETHRFVHHTVFEADGTLTDVFGSNETFIDETLREFYGWSGTASPDAPFVIPEAQRSGIFMQGAVLSANSSSVESDALHRGLFVFRDLLCNGIAPPEGLDVNTLGNLLDSPDPEDTERQRFEFLQENSPECAGCHGLFVPLGLSLETFDATGVFRESDNGRALDPSGSLVGSDNDGPFADARELLERIGASAKGQACFAQHWVSFAFGGEYRVPTSTALLASFRERELRVRDLLLLVTQEDAFYLRRDEEER
jgi:hypothetical protein